jgi:hypothetical protein
LYNTPYQDVTRHVRCTQKAKRYSAKTSPFLNEVGNVLRLKDMSRRTETSYVYYIIDFIRFHGKRQPQTMGLEEIRACLSHLAIEGKMTASILALLFVIHAHVLNRGGRRVRSPLDS